MTGWFYVGGFAFMLVAGIVVAARWVGRSGARAEHEAAAADIARQQRDAALGAPDDRRGVVERLRDAGF